MGKKLKGRIFKIEVFYSSSVNLEVKLVLEKGKCFVE